MHASGFPVVQNPPHLEEHPLPHRLKLFAQAIVPTADWPWWAISFHAAAASLLAVVSLVAVVSLSAVVSLLAASALAVSLAAVSPPEVSAALVSATPMSG